MFERVSETQFRIPASLLTAFKLQYDSAQNICESSQCVLLGGVPDVWFGGRTAGLVRTAVRRSKKRLRRNFEAVVEEATRARRHDDVLAPRIASGFNAAFNTFIRDDEEWQSDEESEGEGEWEEPEKAEEENDDDDEAISRFLGDGVNGYSRHFYRAGAVGVDEASGGSELDQMLAVAEGGGGTASAQDAEVGGSGKGGIEGGKGGASGAAGTSGSVGFANAEGPAPEFNRSMGNAVSEGSDCEGGDDDDRVTASFGGPAGAAGAAGGAGSYLTVANNIGIAATPVSTLASYDTQQTSPQVRFPEKHRRSAILFAPAEPCELDATQHVKRLSSREQAHMLGKIRHIASRTHHQASRGTNDVKRRVMHHLLRSFELGEIIKIDRMLVLVKLAKLALHTAPFTEAEPCDTRVYERWREYLVVLRKTDTASTGIEMQFYDVANKRRARGLKDPDISFGVNMGEVRAQFYSIVDKTIAVTVPEEPELGTPAAPVNVQLPRVQPQLLQLQQPRQADRGLRVYILQCHDQYTSFRWLFFLRELLCYKMNPLFQISMPYLGLLVTIKVPPAVLREMYAQRGETTVVVNQLPRGYAVEHTGLVRHLKDALLSRVADFHKVSPDRDRVADWITNPQGLWLCYKFYDRLEWAPGNNYLLYIQNLLRANDYMLELRTKQPSPRHTEDGLEEPTAVEGFLLRLTAACGHERHLLRTAYRMLYFYSCLHVLFYTKFYRGIPPSPANALITSDDGAYDAIQALPEVYLHSPFELNLEGHIEWLNEAQFDEMDRAAMVDLERRSYQIVKSEGCIDLSRVKQVRPVPFNLVKVIHKRLVNFLWYQGSAASLNDEEVMDSALEVEMLIGGVVRLQAPSRSVRNEWVARLQKLAQYWRARQRDDNDMMIATRHANKLALQIDNYTDSNIAAEAGNVELMHAVAEPRLYNTDCLSLGRCVLMSGYLYLKPKMHANFVQYFVVLCPGFLLMYHMFKRSAASGVSKQSSYYRHFLTIPINDSYVYSGETTSLDLLFRNGKLDSLNPGRHPLPRVYLDGWRLLDEEPTRCFSLWLARKSTMYGRDKAALDYIALRHTETTAHNTLPRNPGYIKLLRKFGLTGRKILFMARLRQERELWVTRILTEIDRFSSEQRD